MTRRCHSFEEYYSFIGSQKSLSRVPRGYVEGSSFFAGASMALLTSHVISTDDEWIVTCSRNSDSSGNRPIMGTGLSKTDSNMALWLNPSTNLVEFIFGDGGSNDYEVVTSSYDVKKLHTYRMKLSTGEGWIDGNYIGKAKSVSSIPNPKRLAILGCYRGSTMFSTFLGSMTELIVKQGDTEMMHFIPGRRWNIVNNYFDNGLYDIARHEWNNTGGIVCVSYDADWDIGVDANEEYSIKLTSYGFGEAATIDWGDGSTQTISTNVVDTTYSHTYSTAGEYSLSLHVPHGVTLNLNYKSVNSNQGNATIRRVNNFTSTFIPDKLCFGSNYMTDIYMHGDVSAIGQNALTPCFRLNLHKLPESISIFGHNSMSKGSLLDFSRLPKSTTCIESGAFSSCERIALRELPEGLLNIKSSAFYNCLGITSMTLPSTIDAIGNEAFDNCKNLTKVTFKGMPSEVSSTAFRRCTALTDIYVPWRQDEAIGEPWGATNATVHYRYSVPSSNEIWYYAPSKVGLYDNSNVVSHDFSKEEGKGVLKFASAVTSVGQWLRASNATHVILPDGVTSLERYCFRDMEDLTWIGMPDGLTYIGQASFYKDASLHVNALPSSVESILSSAFWNCRELKISSLPPGLTILKASSFKYCYKITIEEVPSNVTRIEDSVFLGCSSIVFMELPANLEAVYTSVFNDCTALTKVHFKGGIIPPIDLAETIFHNCGALTDIYVPWDSTSSVNVYSPWSATNATIHYNCPDNVNWRD